MKKKLLLIGLFVLTMFCMAACGRRMNSATDGTNKNDTITETPTKDPVDDTDRNDNVVDGMMDGVEDTVDGVMDGTEDVVNGMENSLDTKPDDGNVNEKVLPDNNDNTVNDQHNTNDQNNRMR